MIINEIIISMKFINYHNKIPHFFDFVLRSKRLPKKKLYFKIPKKKNDTILFFIFFSVGT